MPPGSPARAFLRCVLSCVVAALASACASHGAVEGTTGPLRTLRLGFRDQLRSLNPIYLDGFSGGAIDALAFSYLLRPLPDGRLVPDIALAVPTLANGGISADGRMLTYRLRRNARWQDGAPLTSADVAFTVRAIMNPSDTVGSRDPFDRILRLETPDPYTVRVVLRKPDAAVAALFFTPDANAAILPAHLLARYPSLDHVPFNGMPIGSGPYRIVRWDRGSTVRFTANPSYFGGKPKVPAIELRYAPDSTSMLIGLQTGELDGVLNADRAFTDRYRVLPRLRVTRVPGTQAKVLVFNDERAPLDTVAMRRALAQAVDAPSLVRAIYHGAVAPGDASRGLFSYADDPRAGWPAYGAARASAALDALGWRRDASGTRHRAGRELSLALIYPNESAANRIAAVALQQAYGRLGVHVDLQGFEYTQFWGRAGEGAPLANGRFDLALVDYSTNVDPDQAWLLACRERAPAGFNESRYCNPRVDALLAASSLAFDRNRRIDLLQRMQRIAAADVPFLPLWQDPEIDVVPKSLRGFEPNGDFPFSSARDWIW